MSERKRAIRQEKLTPTMGGGTFERIFGDVLFLACLLELIKNSRDWRATSIRILTVLRHQLVFIDNGDGMNLKNRKAFISVGETTAKIEDDQSGRFCTGTKRMLYSHCSRVRVRTAPKDDLDHVYVFEIETATYEDKVKREEPIASEVYIKDETTWPHGDQTLPLRDRTGTELTYEFADPDSGRLDRGNHLAEELSSRLPLRFVDIIEVDGKRIPSKKVIGTVFTVEEQCPELGGPVRIELYHSAQKRREEGLFLGSLEVGEAPISSLRRILPPAIKELFPRIYSLPEVCGTITAKFLNDYCVEKRDTINPKIIDSRALPAFIRVLDKYAAEVQRRLKIRHDEIVTNWDETEKEDIHSFVSDFNDAFNTDGAQPTVSITEDLTEEGQPVGTGGNASKIYLEHVREVEIGEVVAIKLHVNKELAGEVDLKRVQWIINRAGGRVDHDPNNGGISVTAKQVGDGYVRADVPGTSFSARAVYKIVRERRLSLSTGPIISIEVGAEIPIFVRNSDKVKGQLVWELRGHGSLKEASGARGAYVATHAGTGTVRVWGDDKPDCVVETTFEVALKNATPMVEVKPRRENRELIPIDGVWFNMDAIDSESALFHRPVTMLMNATGTTIDGQNVVVHEMKVNRSAPGYEQARRTGRIREFLRDAAASEFPRFKRIELEALDLAELEPDEIRELIDKVLLEKFQILERIQLKQSEKKVSSQSA